MRRWAALIIFVVLLVAAGVAVFLWWRGTPPAAARLLPDADGYFYINFEALRHAGVLNQLPAVTEDPEYREFIQATGFRFERDLDSVAFAIHGAIDFDSAVLSNARFTEIFTGTIDQSRATNYFRKMANHVAQYHEHEVFYLARPDYTVRLAFLDAHNVAVSSATTDDPIHAIIDNHAAHSPPHSPAMLREFYEEVPVGSLVWLIGKTSPEPHRGGGFLNAELRRMLAGCTLVASGRFITALDLRVEAIAPSDEQASRIAENVGGFLQLYAVAEQQMQPGGADPDIRAALHSLHVEQQGRRVLLTASIPPRVLRKLAQ